MVSAGDSYRRHNLHTCHKHCKNPEESKTGRVRVTTALHPTNDPNDLDEIDHCQECKKWNSTDKFPNQPQPIIVIKIKRSLITNLGNTALTQLGILMLCSVMLTAASLAIAVM
jgi:hypothetical protein